MRKTILLTGLLLLVICTNAKKRAATGLWPDGTSIDAWFNDTTKIDVETLGRKYVITDYGVTTDSTFLQTQAIQQVIDRCAEEGGGVVVFPKGTFLSGALFFKKGTHLHLVEGAKLKGVDDIRYYPLIPMHMEGLPVNYFAALVTAEYVDGFSITGDGVIDGNAQRFWDEFWIRRQWNRQCTNLEALRPQLVYISNSNNVTVQDVALVNSAFWTNHLYRCNRVKYLDCSIVSPTASETRAPSSDAIDLDVCHDVLVRGCYINTCDDGVCMKGGRGTFVDSDSTAGPVRNIIVEKCRFGKFTNAAVTFGSDAWDCRNVIMRDCLFEDTDRMLLFKMRPDTPQSFGDVLVENCEGTLSYTAIEISTWTQFHGLMERNDMPVSFVSNVTIHDIKVMSQRFFSVRKNHPFIISHVTLQNIQAEDKFNSFDIDNIEGLKINNVIVNGKIL